MPETSQRCSFSTVLASWSRWLWHTAVRILTWKLAFSQGLPKVACTPSPISTDSVTTTQVRWWQVEAWHEADSNQGCDP